MPPVQSLCILPQTFIINSASISETAARKSNLVPIKSLKSGTIALRKRNFSAMSALISENGGFRQNFHGVGEKDGVIIVDHGSRRKESNLMLNEFVTMFREKTGYPIVEPAHMELAEPSIKDAFGLCVQQGANRVIVSPFFLFPGRHWNQDIPSLTAEAAKDYPGVSYIVTAPLGLHEQLVDVINDRIKYCLSHAEGDASECSVCAGTNKCKFYSSCESVTSSAGKP